MLHCGTEFLQFTTKLNPSPLTFDSPKVIFEPHDLHFIILLEVVDSIILYPRICHVRMYIYFSLFGLEIDFGFTLHTSHFFYPTFCMLQHLYNILYPILLHPILIFILTMPFFCLLKYLNLILSFYFNVYPVALFFLDLPRLFSLFSLSLSFFLLSIRLSHFTASFSPSSLTSVSLSDLHLLSPSLYSLSSALMFTPHPPPIDISVLLRSPKIYFHSLRCRASCYLAVTFCSSFFLLSFRYFGSSPVTTYTCNCISSFHSTVFAFVFPLLRIYCYTPK